jgi:hypothetical protein
MVRINDVDFIIVGDCLTKDEAIVRAVDASGETRFRHESSNFLRTFYNSISARFSLCSICLQNEAIARVGRYGN